MRSKGLALLQNTTFRGEVLSFCVTCCFRVLRKCAQCGGLFPWISWRMFLFGTADPGNGGPLLQPRGQTSVFYTVPPPPAAQQTAATQQQGAAIAQQAGTAAAGGPPGEGGAEGERGAPQ